MKMIYIITMMLALSGCGSLNRSAANLMGYSKVCVEGVTYLQFPTGAAVQLDTSGKVVPCKE
jgi:uncharacterized protein YceK